ncbi:MAG: alpha-glucosidase [Bacillota bacterium]|nr:alpha-glucosidase [Bacillota bacterium]
MENQWWKRAVVYQLYPRSFSDSNGDGQGDLKGVTAKLDYIKWLGVDVVWLCPVYASPNADNGYDISDYYSIMDEMGTIGDWEALKNGLHSRGIKLIMDMVLNHTSDQHPWFIESRSSRDNPKRDWYIWRKGKPDGSEPNNWGSFFSPSAWEYDEKTGEYYLHMFSPKQPDLNWENPDVRQALYNVIRFWLDKGVDGFRFDVANMYSKVQGFPEAPEFVPGSKYQFPIVHVYNGPRIHEFIQEMNREAFAGRDIMTVGEGPFVTPELALQYAGFDTHEFDMVFHFEHVIKGGLWTSFMPYDFIEFKQTLNRFQTTLYGKAWNSLYLSNHDQPRQVSRFGNDRKYLVRSAKLLGTMIHMQQGTPYVYQGEELGMTNIPFTRFDQYRDLDSFNYIAQSRAMGMPDDLILSALNRSSRDNARTPMQWSAEKNAGFTAGTPWIEVNPNYPEINVETETGDPSSVLNYYRRLIRLRKEMPVIVYGSFIPLMEEHPQFYCWIREYEGERLLVVLNFSDTDAGFALPEGITAGSEKRVLSNAGREKLNLGSDTIGPWEAYVCILE